ncbi:predicted protein [Naegleria gruberi]|uniref:Predicted protein n=1 Tax=Naegleria gruberi TaxID=5762 RepID=D2VUX0_NAEGR|nr:uncharacterized protein NAEGRDRAFT_72814 [Naegleria gruberi]EFC39340.1 predicted protein [Naegleria gruberi]|eukprot:XP_002672084.1 predicted protein [Naegleria gruberi strain NEG-M]
MSAQSGKNCSVCFVCLGNICRSPMAEIVMLALIKEKKAKVDFIVDSCGTASYHVGEEHDDRTLSTCKKYYPWLNTDDMRARQICQDDFEDFDYILVMDESNLRNVNSIRKNKSGKAKVQLLGCYDPEKKNSIVEDPYYGGMSGFESIFKQIKRSLENFIQIIESEQ